MKKEGLRKRIYNVIDLTDRQSSAASAYNVVMTVLIIVSLIPLCFKEQHPAFIWITAVTAVAFIFDYFLRWFVADYELGGNRALAFLRYPFTVNALIDLLSVLPFIIVVRTGFKLLILLRLGRAFRVLRILRYSRVFELFMRVVKRERDALSAVFILVVTYIAVSALIMFSVEPSSFSSFFEAVYWVVITITSVGYGDIAPVTAVGRTISMISALVGMAIVALPTGIIAAGYMSELSDRKNETDKTN